MLGWSLTFFLVAMVAALFGFGVLASSAVGFAKVLFFLFLIAAVVSLLTGRKVGAV
ncbi:MAG: DUF1328 domain-containing protein [Planctomycetota bacterium]